MGWRPDGPVSLICFTRTGAGLLKRLASRLQEDGICSCRYIKSRIAEGGGKREFEEGMGLFVVEEPLTDWVGKRFAPKGALIFIGAAGIAVRASAKWIRDKFRDPAVVVVDEKGQFVIPLLSGHGGGANALALKLAEYLQAVPVITTATDVQGKFAVDDFARERGLWISDRRLAKEISADILEGRPVGFSSAFPVAGDLPAGCFWDDKSLRKVSGVSEGSCQGAPCFRERKGRRIRISLGEEKKEDVGKGEETLYLIPKILTIGIGCRRGIGKEKLKSQVFSCLKAHGISRHAVCQAATIDRKKEEPGLKELCHEMGWPFFSYAADSLRSLPGEFSHSDFVEKTVGVGNVCERAAILGSGGEGARLVFGKQVLDGVALAAAVREWEVAFPFNFVCREDERQMDLSWGSRCRIDK